MINKVIKNKKVSQVNKCCFCGKKIIGKGNNPEPAKPFPNRCCEVCNLKIVIPVRLKK